MNSKNNPILISACLLGINCRYDGTNALRKNLIKRYAKECLIPLCPEQFGGLPTPRPQAEISFKKVIDINGRDVTKAFTSGAHAALKIIKLFNIKKALLKEKSPSCGVRFIYSKGKVIKGMGITARLLKGAGVEVAGVE